MKQEAFRRELAAVTPDVPDAFHQRVEAFLQEKVEQEVNMNTTMKHTLRAGSRIGRRALVIALAAALLLATAALAAANWGIFGPLGVILGAQPPTADSVMHASLHTETVNGVEIAIREAGYDGRTLFLQYSYRLPDVASPLGEIDARTGDRLLSEEDTALLAARHVGWWVDAFWINGQAMDMAGGSGGVELGSDTPGEIIRTEYWRLDNLDVTLSGEVQIALPIGEKQSAAYRQAIFDRETGQYRLPDKGVVTFTFDAGNAVDRVVTLHPNIDTVTPDVTVRVSEAAFTPLMTYVTLTMEPNPDALARFKAEHGEGWLAEDGSLLWPYTGLDVYGEWISSLRLVDGDGRLLFPDHWGNGGCGEAWAEFTYPYMDPDALPQELWLAPYNNGADMSCAIRIK